MRDKSRNAVSNVIRVDKKNKTIGKLVKKEQIDLTKSLGLLADSLQKQGFISVQEKKPAQLGQDQDDLDELN